MLIFASLAIAAFIVVAVSFFFGHDTDAGHDLGHDAGHDGEGGAISIFSTKVIGTFIMGFGATGFIARVYGTDYLISSLLGVVGGVILSALMYTILAVLSRQQSSSIIATSTVVGCTGTVTVPIGAEDVGEIGVTMQGQYMNYSARSNNREPIAKGQSVRVVSVTGTQLMVEKI
jgi:membrane protein implicated in regulation of membrane protease activity